MFKKILKIVGAGFVGFNFGLISFMFPTFLVIAAVISPDDFMNYNILAIASLVIGIIALVGTYIYCYFKKREHEKPNGLLLTLVISFAIGALLIAVLLFIESAGQQYNIGYGKIY